MTDQARRPSDTHPIDQLAIARVRLASLAADPSTSHELREAIGRVLEHIDMLETLLDPPTTPDSPSAKRAP